MVNTNFYIHPLDKAALTALRTIPGFPQLLKAIMKVWSEKTYNIINMSTNLRISEKQLSRYYSMLLPICKKLGIDVPELYLELDVVPNAYTYGDTSPCIVITSGLLETLPDDLISSVLAHECGHIACHHCLYTTIGNLLLNNAPLLFDAPDLVTTPIKIAFAYWMRCSELSADRAAALCDGGSEKVVQTMLRFAGFDKDIAGKVDINEFMSQVLEYRQMVDNSRWNKVLEFLILKDFDHPFNAVRAKECFDWAQGERFRKMADFLNTSANLNGSNIGDALNEAPMPESSKTYMTKGVIEVTNTLTELGFSNINCMKITKKSLGVKDGSVVSIRVNGKDGFEASEWFPIDSEILVEYYEAETEEEILAAHPGQRRMPDTFKRYIGKQYQDVFNDFQKSGFTDIILEEQFKSKKGLFSKNGEVASISVNGQTQFAKGEWFPVDATIKIVYYTF